ncbi:MAG TPA: hypothetical protein VFT71_04260 [Candidatus Nitrosocosmicus sp.]|nr:hypothetical protein [Candidatus Nitrosocosmicus sp.]HSA75752.1 hypothetical protein [Candidatus Nitrosocosmicus sp.]
MTVYQTCGSSPLPEVVKKESEEEEKNLITFICENTDGILDPLDQMTFALNETAIKYGPIVVLKDAP